MHLNMHQKHSTVCAWAGALIQFKLPAQAQDKSNFKVAAQAKLGNQQHTVQIVV